MKDLKRFLSEDDVAGTGKMSGSRHRFYGTRQSKRQDKRLSNKTRRRALQDRHVNAVAKEYGVLGHSSYWG